MELDSNKLNIALAEKCFNLTDLRRECGVGGATVSKLCRGEMKLQPKTLGKIAKALDVKVTDLLKDY